NLATPRPSILLDVQRRTQTMQPVYARGLLICSLRTGPGEGVVVAVDLSTRGLAWACTFGGQSRIPEDTPPEALVGVGLGSRGDCTPVIAGDHVLVTSPDDGSLRCFRLSDGGLLWMWGPDEDNLGT